MVTLYTFTTFISAHDKEANLTKLISHFSSLMDQILGFQYFKGPHSKASILSDLVWSFTEWVLKYLGS